MRARGASSGDAPPPPRSLATDKSSYPPGFPIWYLDLLLLVLLVFGCQFRVSLIFSVTVCDSLESTSVLRFVGPNSIQVWSFPWNSGLFFCKNPIFLVFFRLSETCLS